MDDFLESLASPRTRAHMAAMACTSSLDDFIESVRQLRSDGKLNAYHAQRRPLCLDDDECLRMIGRSLYIM